MMEPDEMEKRINWLDAERQKDKKAIAELQDQVSQYKDEITKQQNKFKSLESDIKGIKVAASRAEKVDADFAEYKTEILKQISEFGKKFSAIETKFEKQRKTDQDQVNKRFSESEVELKSISEIKKLVQSRADEYVRVNQKIDEAVKSFPELRSTDADTQRQFKTLSNDLVIENKRITDLQIETSAIRKRIEEDRSLIDLFKETARKLENRIIEVQASEAERKQNQIAFIEKQSLLQVEKENLWKDWQKQYSNVSEMEKNLNSQLLALDETHRAVKKAQSEFDEINEKFNRRINEITEITRLSEERFRQEWVAFKADDQKRWTNYNLNRDEETREDDRQMTRINDRLIELEDIAQELKDALQIVNDETQKQLKALITVSQELLDSYSQSINK